MTVDAFDAKIHLSWLPEMVIQGKEIMITRHGKPLVRLVPANVAGRSQIDFAIAKLKVLRKNCTLDGIAWQRLRDGNRR